MVWSLEGIPSDSLVEELGSRRYRVSISPSPEMRDNLEGITTQTFTDANSKQGRQYAASVFAQDIAAGGAVDVVFRVGAEKCLMKSIAFDFDVDLVSLQVFRAPSFTGGTEAPVYNYNDEGAVPDDVVILEGATINDPGSAVSPKRHSIGTDGQGTRRYSTVSAEAGVERVLTEGGDYLFRFINESAQTGSIAGVATWYQGPVSTEIA